MKQKYFDGSKSIFMLEKIILLQQKNIFTITIICCLLMLQLKYCQVRKCCLALKQGDLETLSTISSSVEARTQRITEVVRAEMESFEAGVYTEAVLAAVTRLHSDLVPSLVTEVNTAIECLLAAPQLEVGGLQKYFN